MTMVPPRDDEDSCEPTCDLYAKDTEKTQLAMAQVFLLIISFSLNSKIIIPFHPSLFSPLLSNTPVRLWLPFKFIVTIFH